MVTGIHDSNEHSVTITFNVIVPLNYWVWEKNSTIHLHFGHEKLGKWKTDIGDFNIHE